MIRRSVERGRIAKDLRDAVASAHTAVLDAQRIAHDTEAPAPLPARLALDRVEGILMRLIMHSTPSLRRP